MIDELIEISANFPILVNDLNSNDKPLVIR